MRKKPRNNGHKKLNPRQSALVKNLAQGKTITEAAKAAGYKSKYPGQAGSQALKQIRKTWPEILEQQGLTPESVTEKYLIPLMNATECKVVQHNGKFIKSKPMIAWGPRYSGLDIYFRISSAYPDEKKQEVVPTLVQI